VDLLRTTPKKVVIENMQWLAGDEELNDYDEYVACPPPLECALNVAGSRESHATDIQDAVFRLMVDVLIKPRNGSWAQKRRVRYWCAW
jgi:hypothetical protein